MNAKYNELIKIEGKEQALFDTRTYFKEAAQNVGWSADDILPSDKDIAKKIRDEYRFGELQPELVQRILQN